MNQKPSTPEEIELGLLDNDSIVRMRFAQRTDYTPTPEQIERGLRDQESWVRDVFMSRQTEWEATHQGDELREKFNPEMTQKIRRIL
jgi:hypothetical protein